MCHCIKHVIKMNKSIGIKIAKLNKQFHVIINDPKCTFFVNTNHHFTNFILTA